MSEQYIIHSGRPSDADERLQKERETYDRLDQLGIEYSVIDHEHADTIEMCQQIEKAADTHICKNLFLCNSQKTAFYLLLMPGDKPFKTKLLSPQLGCARLSFAPPEYMEKMINCTVGSASVFCLWYDRENAVRLIIDADLKQMPSIGCHPCINTGTVVLNNGDFFGSVLPAIGHEPTYVEL